MDKKIDYEEIAKLVGFLEEKKLTHFELEVEGFKIKIARAAAPAPTPEIVSVTAPSRQPGGENNPGLAELQPQVSDNNIHYVTAPMVGTFYRAPAPNSPPFVDIGDEVKKSQTLCIIEAMKLMNEIESEVDGTISEIFVENGKPVEYGQKLFAIRPLS